MLLSFSPYTLSTSSIPPGTRAQLNHVKFVNDFHSAALKRSSVGDPKASIIECFKDPRPVLQMHFSDNSQDLLLYLSMYTPFSV